MPEDSFKEDEWVVKKTMEAGRSNNGGSRGGYLDYVIVAVIAVIAVMGINNYLFARTGSVAGGFPGGRGCFGRGVQQTLSVAEMEERALQFYLDTTQDMEPESLEASVQDFGCHQEVYIYKNNELVMTVGFGNGRIYRIS